MSIYTWKKDFLRNQNLPLKLVDVFMKEIVHSDYSIDHLKKPCWLVFRHTETNDFCCIGKVDIEHQTLSDVLHFESKKSIIRSYRDWNEIMVKYARNEDISTLEKQCVEKILASDDGDQEWCQLRKYWKSLKQ